MAQYIIKVSQQGSSSISALYGPYPSEEDVKRAQMGLSIKHIGECTSVHQLSPPRSVDRSQCGLKDTPTAMEALESIEPWLAEAVGIKPAQKSKEGKRDDDLVIESALGAAGMLRERLCRVYGAFTLLVAHACVLENNDGRDPSWKPMKSAAINHAAASMRLMMEASVNGEDT